MPFVQMKLQTDVQIKIIPFAQYKKKNKTGKQINKTFNYHSMKSVRKNKILSFSCCKCCAVCNICWSTFVTLTGCRCCHMLSAVTRSLRKTQSIEKKWSEFTSSASLVNVIT